MRLRQRVEVSPEARRLQDVFGRMGKLEVGDTPEMGQVQLQLHQVNPRDLARVGEGESVSSRRGLGSKDRLDNLRASLLQNGLLQPIIVRPAEGAWICEDSECGSEYATEDLGTSRKCTECNRDLLPQYHLVDGQRRLHNARRLTEEGFPGWETISAFVRPVSEADAYVLSLMANIMSESLSPVEQGQAIDRIMRATGWTLEQLAAETGLSASSLSRLHRVATGTTDAAQRLLRDLGAPATVAYQAARIEPDRQLEFIQKVQAKAASAKRGGVHQAAETIARQFHAEAPVPEVRPVGRPAAVTPLPQRIILWEEGRQRLILLMEEPERERVLEVLRGAITGIQSGELRVG